jgi:threonine dehydrogenase-like Zn-dependent dehydrogenase
MSLATLPCAPARQVGRSPLKRPCPGVAPRDMKAVTWHGKRDVRVDEVPDPTIHEPTDAIIRVTSTAICGSDLHLYEVLGPFLDAGDILGHEPMGIVEEVGADVTQIKPGDRVVIPFNISCGTCWMCGQGLQTQCETTQVRDQGMGAALLGYTKLYGQVPGGQAEYLRVPQAHYGPIKVPEGPKDERFLFMSDVLPTAWQAVDYAAIPDGGSVVVLGLGPIGRMACRIARHQGAANVIGVDLVPDRLAGARGDGFDVLDVDELGSDGTVEAVRERTGGRGADAVIDAVGMEAHGAPIGKLAHQLVGLLPDVVGRQVMQKGGIDRLAALYLAIDLVRRGGTISLSGVYGGTADPMPMLNLFDRQIQLRMGQANVKRWIPEILPLLTGDDDPLGVDDFASHQLPLEQAPHAYEIFQKKQDAAFKIVLKPES